MSMSAVFQQAELLRKEGKYAEAGAQFAELWQQRPTPAVGWRHAYCFRKIGDLESAERAARAVYDAFPEDGFVKSELAWILYEKAFKSAVATADLPSTLAAANEILTLKDDHILKRRVVFSVLKLAKSKQNWPVVLEWTNRISPEQLDCQPRELGRRRVMSQREVWYLSKARALLEMGQFEESRQCCQQGLQDFSESVFLRRLAALALAGMGKLAEAIAELRTLTEHPKAAWYMEAELAELEFRAGNTTEAYRRLCHALATCRQDVEFKLTYLATLAQVALALDKTDVAAVHVKLARAVRAQRGWNTPPQLRQVELAIAERLKANGTGAPQLPDHPQALHQLCRHFWQQGQQEGLTFHRGTVKPFPAGRHYCYIRRDDGAGDVYALVQDLPPTCRQGGTRVEFTLKNTFDKKKQRPSVQAVHIRAATD